MSIGTSGLTGDLGPAQVTWGNVVLDTYDKVGFTLTGVTAEVFENVFGATPVDDVFLGYSACLADVPATRITITNLQQVLPGGSCSGTGTTKSVKLNADISVGISHYDHGANLLIQPIIDGVASTTKGIILYKTYPVPNFDVSFDLTTERVYAFQFKAHPGSDGVFFRAGKVA